MRLCYSAFPPPPTPTALPIPTVQPTIEPTVIPASVLSLQPLVPSLGIETLPAPTVAEQSVSSASLVIKACARRTQLKNSREKNTLVVQAVAGKKIISQTKLTAKAGCSSITLTERGVYRAFLKKALAGRPTIRSRSNFFGVF